MDRDLQIQQSKKRVSYSQYSLYKKCPLSYKYKYIDKLGVNETNIALIFGTSMHDTIQSYLYTIYNKKLLDENTTVNDIKLYPYIQNFGLKTQRLDLEKLLKDRLHQEYKKIDESVRDKWVSKSDMIEHYQDGLEILTYLEKNRKDWFKLNGMELVSVEHKLEMELKDGIWFIGYIDLLFKDSGDSFHIIDLKTSKSGWNDFSKKDKTKTNQNLLYKRFFSKLMDVPEEKVNVEFIILKRKIQQDAQFAAMKKRLQRVIPANGKGSVNNAIDDFMDFVDKVHVDKTDEFKPNPTKFNCTYCEFYTRGICKNNFFN